MLKVILVDDELDALEALEWKINRYIKDIKIICKCSTPIEAIKSIEKEKPDLVFLDIKMPEMDGFTLLQRLSNTNFDLVFTTAHDEFALKAIKVSAIDYLLKPIDKDELITAVDKVRRFRKESRLEDKLQSLFSNLSINKFDKINIAADGKIYLLERNDVIMLKSDKSYTTIFLENGKEILVSKTLKEVSKKFEYREFFRVHNSYLINMNHIREFLRSMGGELIMSNGLRASVSRAKKSELLDRLL